MIHKLYDADQKGILQSHICSEENAMLIHDVPC